MSRTWLVLIAVALGACGGVEVDREGPAARGKADDKATTAAAEQVVYYRLVIDDDTFARKTQREWKLIFPRNSGRRLAVHVVDIVLERKVRLEVSFEATRRYLVEAGFGEKWIDVGCEGHEDGTVCATEVAEAVDAMRDIKAGPDEQRNRARLAYLKPEPLDLEVERWSIDTAEEKQLSVPHRTGQLRLSLTLHEDLYSFGLDIIATKERETE